MGRRLPFATLLLALSACTPKVTYKPIDFMLFYAGMAERVHAAYVTPDFFENKNAKPLLGRLFNPDEYKPDPTVVILTNSAFQRFFHADPATVGRPVTLAGANFTVVAILPSSFETPNKAEFLLPKDDLTEKKKEEDDDDH